MTAPYLLSLAELHAAAPGVLDVVFGPDGDFEGAPRFAGPVFAFTEWWTLDCTTINVHERGDHHVLACNGWATSLDECYLDLRIPSVAARLLRLCSFIEAVDADLSPEALANLTLAWAPQIAALRTT